MAKYENIEDLLPLGKKTIEIEPQDKWEPAKEGEEKGHFIKGVQQTRVIKNGPKKGKIFWVFKSPDVIGSNGYPVQINAWDEDQKRLFENGTVEVNVIQGKDFLLDEDGEPIRGEDGKSIRKKKAFFNPVREETSLPQEVIDGVAKMFGGKVVEEEIRIEDISF